MRISRNLIRSQACRAPAPFKVMLGGSRASKLIKPLFLGGAALVATFGMAYAKAEEESSKDQPELLEKEIGKSKDFPEGEMKQIQIGPDKDNDIILVARLDGKLYAVGGKCSHFGAPLAQGAFFDNLVSCPWHLAAFDVRTGYAESGPMIDGIPTYHIIERDGVVTVKVPEKITQHSAKIPIIHRDPNNTQKFVIVGGGIAGVSAVESLRQSGFTGEIVLLTAEEHLPYDRSMLSKNLFNVEPDKIAIRDSSRFDELGVEVKTSTHVTKLDASNKTITTKDGETIHFDKVLVATGASPIRPQVPGSNLNNIFCFRDFTDVYKIRDSLTGSTPKKIVIVGGGLIGTEVASNIKLEMKENADITIVSKDVAFKKHFGHTVGGIMTNLTTENGVKFIQGNVQSYGGEGSNVSEVVLNSGEVIQADVVILGMGVRPNTWFLKDVALDKDGGVNADIFLRSTTNKDVFAAGDIVSYPYHYTTDRIRVEHLSEAFNQGTHAAWNMLGKMVPYSGVPFYWSRQWNKSVACVGYLKGGWDDVVIDGTPDDFKFAAYYFKGNRLVGLAGMMRGKDMITVNHAMKLGIPITKDYLKGTALNLDRLQEEIKSKGGSGCHCHRAAHTKAPCHC